MRVLFLSLICLAALAVSPAKAQASSCGGTDLLAELQRSDPQRYDALRAKAASAPNHEGRAWRIESEGVPPSLLFGTIHRSDPRLTDLPASVRSALASARTVLVEIAKADAAAFEAEMRANPTLTLAGKGPFFDDGFTQPQKKMAAGVLATFGLPYQNVRMLNPAMVLSIVSFSPCILSRMRTGALLVDQVVEQLGRESGAKIVGLESPREQWTVFEAISGDGMKDVMLSSFAMAAEADDYHETLLQAYLRDETQIIWEFNLEKSKQLGLMQDPDEISRTVMDVMVVERNRTMADRAAPEFEMGGVVMAVGALHLPGEEGLVELLRRKGFTVTRVE